MAFGCLVAGRNQAEQVTIEYIAHAIFRTVE